MLEKHQSELIEHAMAVGALKFGTFTLKSGRVSPYFFNAGLISSGSMLATLSTGYASLIHSALQSSDYAKFDILFGPAYKGISLAACTAMALHRDYGIDIGFAYDRKEAKDHGEGGMMVGAPVSGKKVLILDDVMTAGTATRNAVDMIRSGGGEVVGIVLCLDREEVGKEGGSTVKEMEKYVGGQGRVKAILRMRDLMAWLEGQGRVEDLAAMKDYWDRYGVGDNRGDQ
ncbi:orotate phosphoribosyltransferase [Thelephora terrestris]|uniref:orotate phosphoribosyltransferase n=1 Tax=Thelephora terrestris TaxID=56493 RepID=A0A9P6L8U1_9AGAM|nr:orotate phosphoribosyltransferase [Thelephora terrestris]